MLRIPLSRSLFALGLAVTPFGCSTTVSGSAPASTTTTASASSSGGAPDSCSSNADCAANEVCAFADFACGKTGIGRACIASNGPCMAGASPGELLCGCDGKLYPSLACAMAAGGMDQTVSNCALTGTQFACGQGVCDAASEYCLVEIRVDSGMPGNQYCGVFPDACPVENRTCDCVAKHVDLGMWRQFDSCSVSGDVMTVDVFYNLGD